jgi:hypothetical protein
VGKLIKYEFILRGKRMLVFLAAALGLTAALYLFLRFSAHTAESAKIAATIALLSILFQAFYSLLFIDILVTYSRDLNRKEGYMLFLTPHSGWQIVGSKLLSGLLEGLGFLLFFFGLAYVNIFIAYEATVKYLVIFLDRFLSLTSQLQGVLVLTFITFALFGVVLVINSVTTAYAAMTLRRGFCPQVRAGWLITAVLYIVIGAAVFRLQLIVMKIFPLPDTFAALNLLDILAAPNLPDIFAGDKILNFLLAIDQRMFIYALTLALITAPIFFGAAYVLEKKVDL